MAVVSELEGASDDVLLVVVVVVDVVEDGEGDREGEDDRVIHIFPGPSLFSIRWTVMGILGL